MAMMSKELQKAAPSRPPNQDQGEKETAETSEEVGTPRPKAGWGEGTNGSPSRGVGWGCRAQGFLKRGLGRPVTEEPRCLQTRNLLRAPHPCSSRPRPLRFTGCPAPAPHVALSQRGWRRDPSPRKVSPQCWYLPTPKGTRCLLEPDPVSHLWHTAGPGAGGRAGRGVSVPVREHRPHPDNSAPSHWWGKCVRASPKGCTSEKKLTLPFSGLRMRRNG